LTGRLIDDFVIFHRLMEQTYRLKARRGTTEQVTLPGPSPLETKLFVPDNVELATAAQSAAIAKEFDGITEADKIFAYEAPELRFALSELIKHINATIFENAARNF
jgi:hypothetical protein